MLKTGVSQRASVSFLGPTQRTTFPNDFCESAPRTESSGGQVAHVAVSVCMAYMVVVVCMVSGDGYKPDLSDEETRRACRAVMGSVARKFVF